MAQNIGVAIIGLDAKVQGFLPAPLVVDRLDELQPISKPELHRPLIGFVAGVTFHAKLHASSLLGA
jgi:hypothetical protein